MGRKHIIKVLLFLVVMPALSFFACLPSGGGGGTSQAGAHDVLHIKGTSNFQDEVLDHSGTVLVDFTAGWCPPCRKLSPHINKLAGEMEGQLKVVKVYEDEKGKPNNSVLSQYRIKAYPTLIIFKSGSEVAREVGYKDYGALKSWVERNL